MPVKDPYLRIRRYHSGKLHYKYPLNHIPRDLQHVNMIREITLVDRNLDRAKAEIMDARDAFLASAETIRNAAISVVML